MATTGDSQEPIATPFTCLQISPWKLKNVDDKHSLVNTVDSSSNNYPIIFTVSHDCILGHKETT